VTAPASIIALVERFREQRDAYQSGKYNETQLRREFLDPFFTALGWDVDNEQGHAEAYKDVVHEDAIKVGGWTKAPDYAFRVGGARKFFVEAKKPSVDIKGDVSPAFQLRRYAWSAKLPLSILTDFEEFAVYDCRVRPYGTDKASVARVMYLTFEEYAEKWDQIVEVFSREAVLKGSFDRYAESKKKKRGTAEVDEEFLKEIEGWRDALARNLALRNEPLSQRELNFAVQRVIDRIIFLRICEDRGIEQDRQLHALVNGAEIYQRLVELFRRADDRYNSGLFHFRKEKGRQETPDELTLGLAVDDKVLKDIIVGLYYPESPYEFSVLPADILGQVYEQFLGKIIRLTPGHRAVVEDKPEVKKAGGVYYTPTYIVDYIVEQTVGNLLEGKTPKQAADLRILDPACGSGSFLLGAYQKLLDWHRDWYEKDGRKKHKKELYQGPGGVWRLTSADKKRILLNNIFGVDIDSQAVEVTKLSLLLKVLEGESAETIQASLRLFHERALPDLGNNIKCGNSLIGSDFYHGKQFDLLDDEERYRINVFDWDAEFPNVFGPRNPGFNAVIGNPPYVRMEEFKPLKDYFRAKYACHDERSDLYAYFLEKGHLLLRKGGRFGMIVSNKFLRANYGKPLRQLLTATAAVERVADFAGLPVFRGATVRTVVLVTSRDGQRTASTRYSPPPSSADFAGLEAGVTRVGELTEPTAYDVAASALGAAGWSFVTPAVDRLLKRLREDCTSLRAYTYGRIWMGIKSGLTEAFVIDRAAREAIIDKNPGAEEIIKPFLYGRDIGRYGVANEGRYLIYTHHGINIGKYPAVERHLRPFRQKLEGRATEQEWYELQQPQFAFSEAMARPKIVFPDIATEPRFALDDAGYFGANTVYFIPQRDAFLCGLLNSSLAFLYFRTVCAGLEGKNENYLRFFGQYLEGFPVPVATTREGKALAEQIGQDVEEVTRLRPRVAAVRIQSEKAALERQITAGEQKIDEAVSELYELSDKERRIVEEANRT